MRSPSSSTFGTVERDNIELTSDSTAPVNADMKLGEVKEVDHRVGRGARRRRPERGQRQVFTAPRFVTCRRPRNLDELVNLVPGITLSAAALT